MNKNSSIDPVTRAYRYCRELIQRPDAVPGQRLPSVSVLACAAGVSRTSMLKATRQHATQGGLVIRRRHGIFIPAKPDSAEMMELISPPWKIVRERLLDDISSGIFGRDNHILARKELQVRYGVSYNTLTKAILALTRDGYLAPGGRRILSGRATTAPKAEPVFLLADDRILTQNRNAFSERESEFLQRLEIECKGLNVPLLMLGISDLRSLAKSNTPQSPLLTKAIVWCDTLEGTEQILSTLRTVWYALPPKTHRSMALISELMPGKAFLPSLSPHSAVLRFSYTHEAASGKLVADYLRSLGHTDVAYLSIYDGHEFSRARGRSLTRAFEDTRGLRHVHPFVKDTQASQFYDSRNAPPASFIATQEFQTILDLAGRFTQWGTKKSGSLSNLQSMNKEITNLVADEYVTTSSLPLYEAALSNKKITAWVCVNDHIAIGALDFLRSKGVAVPGHISVMGFDNLLASFQHNLTSYYFNTSAVVHQALLFVLSPQFQGQMIRKKTFTESEGYIIERGSMGPARQNV